MDGYIVGIVGQDRDYIEDVGIMKGSKILRTSHDGIVWALNNTLGMTGDIHLHSTRLALL